MKETIFFAHANGFPSKSYTELFTHLEDNYSIDYIDVLAHNPLYPVTENWTHLEKEICDYIKTRYDKKIIALGHSLGGLLLFRVAYKNPTLFKGLIILDSPIMGRFKSELIRFAKRSGLLERFSPAGKTLARRATWDSLDEAIHYFRAKKAYQDFTQKSLEYYIKSVTRKENSQLKLNFDPKIEYLIYMTLPHNLYKLKRKIPIPSLLIYGDRSYAVHFLDRLNAKWRHQMELQKITGSHLFPFEKAEESAQIIMSFCERI